MMEQNETTGRPRISPRVQSPVAAAGLTPKEVIGILRRHLFLIASLAILGVVIGVVSWFLLLRYYPRYTAMTYIKVFPPVEKDPMQITSGVVNKDIQYGYRLTLASLIKQQSSFQKLLKDDKIQQTKWFQSFGDTKAERMLEAFRNLKKRLGVSASRDAEFIQVSMTCGNDLESALIVNTMVNWFVSSRGVTRREDVSKKLAGLNDQMARVERELAASERSLNELRKASGFSDLEEHAYTDPVTRKLNDLERDRNELVLDISQLQATLGNLEFQATGPVSVQVENLIENDPTVVRLTQRLADLESYLAGLLVKFGENHRVVRETRETVNEVRLKRQKRRDEIAEQTRQANLRNAQDQLLVLQRRLSHSMDMQQELVAKKAELDFAKAQYKQRVAIRDERRKTLDVIKAQVDKIKIIYEDPETPRVQSMGRAPKPLEPSFPKLKICVPAGGMLGLMLGLGIAFLIELMNDMVRTPRDVVRYLRIPLLGVIPDADEDELLDDVDLYHVLRQAPYSVVSESYRRFCTNLKLSERAKAMKVLLVSSSTAGDGTTSAAVNLATALVAENKKVLLIDTNFWHPCLHTIFPVDMDSIGSDEHEQLGLSNILMGLCNYDEVVRDAGMDGFDIINAGPLPSTPGELLSSERMNQLVEYYREKYDYVILDGPPVLLVSAAKSLAKAADATVLVFNASMTHRGAALRAIREFREVDASITGCLLFAVRAMKGGYFNEQFKSYQKYQRLQLTHSI